MMNSWVETFAKEGIVLFLKNGELKYKAPKTKMTDRVFQLLRANKEYIIEELREIDKDSFGLTPIQNAYLLGRQSEYELGNTGAHYYTEYYCENLDLERFKEAVKEAAKKYEIFRTVIYRDGRQRVINPESEYTIELRKNCTKLEIQQIREKWCRYEYKLGTWPMIHIIAAGYDEYKCKLVFSFDCMLLDGWSAQILIENIFKIYHNVTPETCEYTFREYVMNLNQWIKKNIDNTEAETYWDKKITTLPEAPKLPYKCDFRLISKPRVNRIRYDFTIEETDKIIEYTKEKHFTVAALLATCLMKVLAKYSSQKSMTLNLTLFNRYDLHPDVSKLIGDFTNIALCSYDYDPTLNFEQEIKQIQSQFWKLVKYRNYNGVKILNKLSKGDPYKAVMPVVFTCMYQAPKVKADFYPDGFREVYSISQTPQVVLDCQVNNPNGTLVLAWDYVEQAFEENTIKSMFDEYIDTVKKI